MKILAKSAFVRIFCFRGVDLGVKIIFLFSTLLIFIFIDLLFKDCEYSNNDLTIPAPLTYLKVSDSHFQEGKIIYGETEVVTELFYEMNKPFFKTGDLYFKLKIESVKND